MVTFSRRESHTAVQIHLNRDGIDRTADATGFLWEANDKLYLVTNVHCLTGWNFDTNTAIGGFVPDHVAVNWSLVFSDDDKSGEYLSGRRSANVSLFEKNGTPEWFVHPEFFEKVDVAVIELSDLSLSKFLTHHGALRLSTIPVNKIDWFDFEPAVGDEAFVLGFPLSLNGGHGFPLWKRATVATEPSFNISDLPLTLVDTATRRGMSGSPVFIRRSGLTYPRGITPPKNALGDDAVLGEVNCFYGVYSGRIIDTDLSEEDNEFQAQLGRVWKASVIQEILAGGAKGIQGGEIR